MAIVGQAGGLVFKVEDGETRILVVRARKDPSAWIFPKGHVEPGEIPAQAALREVREEAGVEGVVVQALQPALDFASGSESVRVEYFLIAGTNEGGRHERREKRWLPPDQAIALLTYEDARRLLRNTLSMIEAHASGGVTNSNDDAAFRDLLLAEYQHVAESLLRNEEDGEKRVTFLITLAGGVAAALGLVLGKDTVLSSSERHPLVLLTLAILFAIGYLTLVRVVTRNATSDRYKEGLNRIRTYFLQSSEDPRLRFLPFDPHKGRPRKPWSWKSTGRGGWLPTVVLVDSFFLGAFASTLCASGSWWINAAVGAVAVTVAWPALIYLANRKYREARQEG
jgi:8-oxo-dGTP pyrophosphatase MutT (NUDIX family)